MKVCTKCNLEKENLEFNKSKTLKSGLTSWCKQCARKYNLEYRKKNSEYLKKKKSEYHQRPEIKEYYNKRYRESKKIFTYNKRRNLKKYYNLTLDEYNKLLETQNESCKICKIHQSFLKKSLSVDHCHKTNKIRGLLCDTCNRAIGMLKDDIQILQNAIQYLQEGLK